jgi:hypothetical protein
VPIVPDVGEILNHPTDETTVAVNASETEGLVIVSMPEPVSVPVEAVKDNDDGDTCGAP